jgi:hypothetical protein
MAVDRERLRDELRRMRALIQKDPETLARFDTDGNGVIDGHEWEQVRQLVIQRLEREEAEAIEAGRLASAAGEAFAATAIAPGSVASAIYEIDLSSTRSATSLPGGIAEADEMVLEQQGGLGQLFEGMVRRRYSVFSTDGSLLGSIDQVENEMMQEPTGAPVRPRPSAAARVSPGMAST